MTGRREWLLEAIDGRSGDDLQVNGLYFEKRGAFDGWYKLE